MRRSRLCNSILAVLVGLGAVVAKVQAQSGPALSPGDSLPGLTAEELALFAAGKADFEEVEEVEEGLGPAFNAPAAPSATACPPSGAPATCSRRELGSFVEANSSSPRAEA